MQVKAVGARGLAIDLEEVHGSQVELGKMYHVIFEEKDDDGQEQFSHDSCWIINGTTKRPDSNEFFKALQFTKLARTFRFSELTMKCYFFGPISFEIDLEG